MKDRAVRTRDVANHRRTRSARPRLEDLEDRLLLYAANGDVFTYGSRITWSVMPDGTSLGGATSNLVSTLDDRLGGENNWIVAFEDAFAQWENSSNVNFSKVSDDGSAENSGNYQQGAPNFGDVRIGGYPMAANILAYTLLPPPSNGGSAAGDIFFNTNIPWSIGSGYDLESVALHEIGHDVGLGESSNPNAVMYVYYNGVQQTLASDDIAGVQSIWGPRAEDGLAAGNSNFTSAKAANITPFLNGANNQIILPDQDVASSAQSYWFKVTTPSNASNNLTVQVQSTALSELSPKVQIYNGSLKGLVQVSAPGNAYGATINASISNATPNTTYYIRVLGSNGGDTGTGAYGMTVNMGSNGINPVAPPNTVVYAQPDQGGGGSNQLAGGPGSWPVGIGSSTPGPIQQLSDWADDYEASTTFQASIASWAAAIVSELGGGNPTIANLLTSLISSIAGSASQASDGTSALALFLQDLSNDASTPSNAPAGEPTVLIDVPHPVYSSTSWT